MTAVATRSPQTLGPSGKPSLTAVAEAAVGMGQIALLLPEGVARTVLGSCVGLVLFHPTQRFAAMAHIVLPDSNARATTTPGKFVDTAVAAMIDALRRHAVDPAQLVAKLSGGANMFESKGPFQIGTKNIEAVYRELSQRRIRLLGEHVGGTHGRRATFDCRTGAMSVEVVGSSSVTF